jgi:hypothetical protein
VLDALVSALANQSTTTSTQVQEAILLTLHPLAKNGIASLRSQLLEEEEGNLPLGNMSSSESVSNEGSLHCGRGKQGVLARPGRPAPSSSPIGPARP